ncbi:hypothetical protein PG990_010479 [Apiospora arundinis]
MDSNPSSPGPAGVDAANFSDELHVAIEKAEKQINQVFQGQLERSEELKMLKTKLAKSKACQNEQKATIKTLEEALQRAKCVFDKHAHDVDATEKAIKSTKENVEDENRLMTLYEELNHLRSRLPALDAQGERLQVGASKKHSHCLDGLCENIRKRRCIEEHKEPGFHVRQDWTRATFLKANGLLSVYAPVCEKARKMTSTVILTLESLMSPMPLQIRRVFEDLPSEMRIPANANDSDINSIDDKQYHVFLDRLTEGIQALQDDVRFMAVDLASLMVHGQNRWLVLNHFEKTYTWHELHSIIGFNVADDFRISNNQLRLSLYWDLKSPQHIPAKVQWNISELVGNLSRYTAWTALLGRCLMEGYGRGDSEDDDDDIIRGLGIRDLATTIKKQLEVQTGVPVNVNNDGDMRPIRPDYLLRQFSPSFLDSEELDGIPTKVLDKLSAHFDQPVARIRGFLLGMPLPEDLLE